MCSRIMMLLVEENQGDLSTSLSIEHKEGVNIVEQLPGISLQRIG
jgi:hypothetical protein